MAESDSSASGRLVSLLEIVGLWCLAIVQPLFELLSRNAPFLLHHRADGIDLVVWMVLLALLPPILLWLLVEAVGRSLGESLRSSAQAAMLGTLLVCLVLGILRRLGDPLPAALLLPLAAMGIWLAATLFRRFSALRWICSMSALALPLVALLFWNSGAATATRATHGAARSSISSPDLAGDLVGEASDLPPVVLVVFDELPLVSILGADLQVDGDLCPNLAALSHSATWFRNASTVWSSTTQSIVSMLIGRQAERLTPPTRGNYPDNLLTWLQTTHEVRAFEPLTAMAPPDARDFEPRLGRADRLWGLTADALIIVAHQTLPPELGGWLSPIDNRWGGFSSERVVRGRASDASEPSHPSAWAFALADGRERRFETFLRSLQAGERPGMHFAHLMLPHMPYRYLPSGRVYGGRPVFAGPSAAWAENEWFALHTYQRHLLQIGYVDRLVGALIDRLQATGLWERALVIITSDHGASHWPGQDRRLPGEMEHPDDVLRVPLFVKTPHQKVGAVDDRMALTTDILPTVAAVLGRELTWSATGVSLLGEPRQELERRLRDPTGGDLHFVGRFAPDQESLSRKMRLFDPTAGEFRWVRFGPYRELIGRKTAEIAAQGLGDRLACAAILDQLPVTADFDPGGRYSPALLTGEVTCEGQLPEGVFVLASVNGRIGGSGAMQRVNGGRGLFAVMTAESLWRAGVNDVELLIASRDQEEPLRLALERVLVKPPA